MSLFYFEALPKERGGGLSAPQNLKISQAWMARTYEALGPFYRYLDTAIKTAENKQEIKAEWKAIDHADLLRLEPITRIYRREKISRIRVRNNTPGTFRIKGTPIDTSKVDWDEPLRILDGSHRLKIMLEPEHILTPQLIQHPEIPHRPLDARWDFLDFQIEPAWAVLTAGAAAEIDGQQMMIRAVEGDMVEIAGHVPENSRLLFQGSELDLEILTTATPPTTKLLRESVSAWYMLRTTDIPNAKEILPKEYPLFFSLNKLKFEDGGRPVEGTLDDDMPLSIRMAEAARYANKVVVSPEGLRFTLTRAKQHQQTRQWIQLLEPEASGEEQHGLSPLRYFFDDEIEIADNEGKLYQIVEGIESERKMLLRGKAQHRHETCLPDGKLLSIKVNTHQLKMQKIAVQALQSKPVQAQRKLIQLLEDREHVRWPHPDHKAPPIWQVLTDDRRSGATEQRAFVQQALETPDFAILEGPPGSGKTTVILELICQLVMAGKRVLLCGSTHVAIDNVLERLKGKELLRKNGILPVRIGDEHRISDSVREFQLNKLIESTAMPERLLLEAANLVCGTTIGILQHPILKQNRGREQQAAPIVPSFDYLIIDECSKTTFQEFLVPAMFARHWVLVGDVRQLSPFTDRDQLSANISHLELKEGKVLPEAHQTACHELYQLAKTMEKGENFYPAVYVSEEVAACMALELAAGLPHNGLKGRLIAFIGPTVLPIAQPKHYVLLQVAPMHASLIAAYAADILIISGKQAYLAVQEKLPPGFTVLLEPTWAQSSHAFRTAAWALAQGNPSIKMERVGDIKGHQEIASALQREIGERVWADEIAWRIDREHQLRMRKKQKKGSYRDVIEALMPKAVANPHDLLNRIDTIGQVALPSILELLERGLPTSRYRSTSTLSEGFRSEEKKHRHTRLSFQQRMHPAISAFPRNQFYEGQALQDMLLPNIADGRQWSYRRYTDRSIWLHVQGKTYKNFNDIEVQAVSKELDAFLDFAKKNAPPEGGRDTPNVWEVACLTFYRGQEAKLRDMLRSKSKQANGFSRFQFQGEGEIQVHVQLHTVDKFQGQEADIVFLSMVQTQRDGFMDSPNRLNVAITRARFQLVLVGDHGYFAQKSKSEDLQALAKHHSSSKIEHPYR